MNYRDNVLSISIYVFTCNVERLINLLQYLYEVFIIVDRHCFLLPVVSVIHCLVLYDHDQRFSQPYVIVIITQLFIAVRLLNFCPSDDPFHPDDGLEMQAAKRLIRTAIKEV